MSKDKQRLIDYLAHILQAVERITRYTEELDEVASFCRTNWYKMR